MEHISYDLGQLSPGSVVTVHLDMRANVRLMNAVNYRTYKSGVGQYRFLGGQALKSPLSLRVPSADHWYVAIDLGGAKGRIRSSVSVSKAA
jgi:hypothetical protein